MTVGAWQVTIWLYYIGKYQQTRGAAIIFSAANGAKANSDGSQQGQAGAYDALENDRARRGHMTVADGGDVFATNIPASYSPNNNGRLEFKNNGRFCI